MSLEDGTGRQLRSTNFDSRFCQIVIAIGVVACVAILLSEIAALVTVDPPRTRCPGWNLVAKNGTITSLWWIVAMSGAWTLWISYHAVRWKHFAKKIEDYIARKMTDHIEQGQFDGSLLLNINQLLILVMIGSAVFAALPVIMFLMACT